MRSDSPIRLTVGTCSGCGRTQTHTVNERCQGCRGGSQPTQEGNNAMTDYVVPGGVPAPQLTKEDLGTLSPDEVVKANRLGQFDVIKAGRTPTDTERAGVRWATPEEIEAQAEIDRANQRIAKAEYRAKVMGGVAE